MYIYIWNNSEYSCVVWSTRRQAEINKLEFGAKLKEWNTWTTRKGIKNLNYITKKEEIFMTIYAWQQI